MYSPLDIIYPVFTLEMKGIQRKKGIYFCELQYFNAIKYTSPTIQYYKTYFTYYILI